MGVELHFSRKLHLQEINEETNFKITQGELRGSKVFYVEDGTGDKLVFESSDVKCGMSSYRYRGGQGVIDSLSRVLKGFKYIMDHDLPVLNNLSEEVFTNEQLQLIWTQAFDGNLDLAYKAMEYQDALENAQKPAREIESNQMPEPLPISHQDDEDGLPF